MIAVVLLRETNYNSQCSFQHRIFPIRTEKKNAKRDSRMWHCLCRLFTFGNIAPVAWGRCVFSQRLRPDVPIPAAPRPLVYNLRYKVTSLLYCGALLFCAATAVSLLSDGRLHTHASRAPPKSVIDPHIFQKKLFRPQHRRERRKTSTSTSTTPALLPREKSGAR